MNTEVLRIGVHRIGTVTERLSARLDDAEPVIVGLMERCDALLVAGKALTARVALLEDRAQALSEETEQQERALRGVLDDQRLEAHVGMALWQRLRWLVRGA